jgi:DNA-binding LacI/PurR family transcriptional regulator
MSENGVKTMKDFAAEIGVNRMTVSDIITRRKLPTERMTHGRAKGVPPMTQRTIKQILNIKPARATA